MMFFSRFHGVWGCPSWPGEPRETLRALAPTGSLPGERSSDRRHSTRRPVWPVPLTGLTAPRIRVLTRKDVNRIIPSELGRLRNNLEYLILGGNMLSGAIPLSIFNLSSLTHLSLDHNMLDKASLPPNIGEFLPNLVQLTLQNNSFEGPIPASLGNALVLEVIDLSSNNLSGQIPTSLGKLLNLTVLNLQNNQLVARDKQDWEFFSALINCRSLQWLQLRGNSLSGQVP